MSIRGVGMADFVGAADLAVLLWSRRNGSKMTLRRSRRVHWDLIGVPRQVNKKRGPNCWVSMKRLEGVSFLLV